MHKIKETNNIIKKVINLVLSSKRKMPAYFTGDNEIQKTFLVDFNGLTPEDEYEMASQAWHNQPAISSKIEKNICIKIGEDVMLGCFILTKLGYEGRCDYLKNEIINFNVQSFLGTTQNDLEEIVDMEEARNYFDFCEKFGIERGMA